MLSSLLRTIPKSSTVEPDPEDIFQSSLGLIFTDDLQNQHGDPHTFVRYRSNGYGDLDFEIADPQAEKERTKFAHYLWNAGVLMAELIGGSHAGSHAGRLFRSEEEEWGKRKFLEGRNWWVGKDEDDMWSVKNEKVMELGAGVGLAGIMSALAGAEEVTITDYPAPSIIKTLEMNVETNVPGPLISKVEVEQHLWGDTTTMFASSHKGHYSRILAADTLWLPSEHNNLAKSMHHFLSDAASARIFVIAGFHTGRAKMSLFFVEAVPDAGLEIVDVYEMDADGRRRNWNPDRPEEPIGERKKWLVIARLKKQTWQPTR